MTEREIYVPANFGSTSCRRGIQSLWICVKISRRSFVCKEQLYKVPMLSVIKPSHSLRFIYLRFAIFAVLIAPIEMKHCSFLPFCAKVKIANERKCYRKSCFFPKCDSVKAQVLPIKYELHYSLLLSIALCEFFSRVGTNVCDFFSLWFC